MIGHDGKSGRRWRNKDLSNEVGALTHAFHERPEISAA